MVKTEKKPLFKKLSFIEYVALTRGQQIWYKIYSSFFGVIFAIGRFFKGIGIGFVNLFKKLITGFKSYGRAFKYGDEYTKASFFVMGISNIKRGQLVKGILYIILEVLFIVFMILFGGNAIYNFFTLGVERSGYTCTGSDIIYSDFEEASEHCFVPNPINSDNSANMLLFGVLTIVVVIAFIFIYFKTAIQSYKVQSISDEGRKLPSFKDDVDDFLNSKFHITLLFIPIIGVLVFTILPTLDMTLMAFTSYDDLHTYPEHTFSWVGFENFGRLFEMNTGGGASFGDTFGHLLGWTVIWAIFATFLNFILGVLVATVINRKSIKLKKLWRTCLVLSVALPQFVSLLAMRTFFSKYGPVSEVINRMTGSLYDFFSLSNYRSTRILIIVINIWIGIPYTVLSTTGILMNIPADLYESARIDAASPFTMYFKITLRYILFVMGPSLITQFIGNFNNFGIIYLLSGGGPSTNDYYASAGKTDILVTWLYKLSINQGKYNLAAVVGIIIFLISATLSLIVYRNSASFKNEEDFA